MIKTFRGKLATATQDKISLSGGDIDTGYRIVEIQVIPENPLTNSQEALMQIWKTKQDPGALGTTINFDDDSLIGAAVWSNNATTENYPEDKSVIFDDEVFNQDIYITCNETSGRAMNYLLKLEEIKMKDPETAVVNYRAGLLHGE